ncbi:MAG: D-alanyl-D-alanine carboxypeptidase/D-alanyl-D-alanine-endopeptidase [Ignavibacteriaceae bacterium]|nr:D-alanyl-D-alanine carboxypeptidase/D-alanyl-D-alanine-endopeptidase [Ignavibacteriaceae bacterium]
MQKIIKLVPFVLITSCIGFAQEARVDTVPKYSISSVAEFSAQLEDIFEDPNFNNAIWGVSIQSLVTGEYFYKKNENKLFMPASNQKLLTSAAGLILLGPMYRFKTEIYSTGIIDGSILNGDIIIKGFGDPTISGRFNNDDMTKIFRDWADTLLTLGIDEIKGNIFGDDNAFDDTGLGEGWAWNYESDWFAAPSGALSFNDNCIDIVVKPGKKGEQAVLGIVPESKYAIILNKVLTVGKDSNTNVQIYRERGTNIISVFGSIREGDDSLKIYATINNPTQYFVVTLKDILQQKGISVSGFASDIDDLTDPSGYSQARLLFTHHSVFLKDILKVLNKNSHNFYAEQLLKTIGFETKGYGTAARGIDAVKTILKDVGINTDNMEIVDGSGLSRLNLISPNQITVLLNYMYKSDVFTYFYNSLPVGGVDGTLANRVRKTRAQNNVRAKTGYVNGVRSISGYIFTGDKEPVTFSIIANNFTVPVILADNLQDLVCIRLANFKRK